MEVLRIVAVVMMAVVIHRVIDAFMGRTRRRVKRGNIDGYVG